MFLNLDTKPTLLTLPPELWRLIGMELIDDVASLNSFVRLNYRAFAIGTPLLYQNVDRPEALDTLALPSSARLFNNSIPAYYQNGYTPVHPAGLVKSLKLGFKSPECEEPELGQVMSPVLQVKLQKAFANFAKYAARIPNELNLESNTSSVKKVPALTTLKLICPTLPFFEIFEGINFQPFQLGKLEIWCLAPSMSMTSEEFVRWGEFLSTLFKPSLRQLSFFIGNHPFLSSDYSSAIFRQIGQLAVNLRELYLSIPMPPDNESDERLVANFNAVFESDDFSFPNLRLCSISTDWYLNVIESVLDITPFLLRHPNLLGLSCYIASGDNLIHRTPHKEGLSHLRFCKVVPHDWLAICNPGVTPAPKMEQLQLLLVNSIPEEIEGQLVESFQRVAASLVALSFNGHAAVMNDTSPRWRDVSFSHISIYEEIVKACTNLIYLKCHVNIEILEAGFVALIIKHLPMLRTLKLAVTDGRESSSTNKAEETFYKIWEVLRESSAALPELQLATCSVKYYLHLESQPGCKVFTQSKFREECAPQIDVLVEFEFDSED